MVGNISGSRVVGSAALVLAFLVPSRSAYGAPQGFGSSTPGGGGKSVVRVTTLADSGAGSLRSALSQGNRTIVFDVAGTIRLSSTLRVLGAYVTVDGYSAPSPGITLRDAGLEIGSTKVAVHDVVIRGIRIRDVDLHGQDGIWITRGAHHVLLEHVSVDGCGDGNLDITNDAHDVTVAWSILSGCGKNSLIKFRSQRITLHHNVLVDSSFRNPWISYATDTTSNLSPDVMVDMRNNVVWGWGNGGGGTGIECGGKANVVANYYSSPNTSRGYQENAIILKTKCATGGSGGYAYTAGNFTPDPISFNLNSVGNRSTPYAAATVTTTDACTAAKSAVLAAGVTPLDATDKDRLGRIRLVGCL